MRASDLHAISDSSPASNVASKRAKLAPRIAVVSTCLLLSAATVVPFYFFGQQVPGVSRWQLRMPLTHDMFLHYDQMQSFYRGLAAGEVYPRWEEDTNRGFGAPTTSYYPPGVYYLTSFFYLLSRNWIIALMAAHMTMMIGAAAAIYIYARRTMRRFTAWLVMVLYVVLPYHLIDQYERGAIAELVGFVCMPLILLFIERLFDQGAAVSPRSSLEGASVANIEGESVRADVASSAVSATLFNIGGLAISLGTFLWCHPPTAFQFSLAIAVFLPLLAVFNKYWKGLVLAGAGLALGLTLSAAYLLPAAAEKELIRHEFVAENWPYHTSYVFADTVYALTHLEFFTLINRTWLLNAGLIGLSIVGWTLIKYKSRGKSNRIDRRFVVWLLVGAFATFMMTKLSYALGCRIPMIEIGVFSWRMLAITTLIAALCIGAVTERLVDAWKAHAHSKRAARRLWPALLGLLFVAPVLVFTASEVIAPAYSQEVFEPEEEHLNLAIIPRTAPADPEELPEDQERASLDQDNGTVSIEQWLPQHRVVIADLNSADVLWIRTFAFPGWTATVDGVSAKIEPGEDLGDITIALPSGHHRVSLDYLETPVRRAGRVTTVVSFCITAGLFIIFLFGKVRRRGLARSL
jgi:hypothetical protein